MFGYALLLSFKLNHGMRVFLENYHLEHLSYYFENIDQVESLDKLCDEKSFPWEHTAANLIRFEEDEFKIGKLWNYAQGVSIFLGKYNVSYTALG